MMDAKLGEMEVDYKSEQQVKQEVQDGRCSELEEMDRMGDRGLVFESKVQIADSNDETLEVRYRALEIEKLEIEHELKLLKKENTDLKEQISNLENERNKSYDKKSINALILDDSTEPNEEEELAMVNTALEIEKENAEKDAAMWKQKYEELLLKNDDKGRNKNEGVRLMVDLSSFSSCPNDGTLNLQNAGTPPSHESKQKYPNEAANQSLEMAVHSYRRAKKQLLFEDNNKGIAPQTPSVSKRIGIIDISDSDEDSDQGRGRTSEHDEKDGHEEMMISFTPTAKRKRPSNVVNSDSESDDDDNVPISTLKKFHCSESPENNAKDSQIPVRRRRLRTLREAGETSRVTPTIKDTESDHSQSENVVSESDSEGESLGGFIVGDDDDDDMKYIDIISMFRRNKDCKLVWEREGDMLAAFGKDPVLCMKAVCAIYRQQTADEKVSKEAIHVNGRGFSKFDASRGCQLGEFLTVGDPKGNLKVSVEQLLQHDAMGVDLCRNFALHYSKQLFVIYQSREDPFFCRSEAKE